MKTNQFLIYALMMMLPCTHPWPHAQFQYQQCMASQQAQNDPFGNQNCLKCVCKAGPPDGTFYGGIPCGENVDRAICVSACELEAQRPTAKKESKK